jgi:hypothetical protein
MTDRPTMETPYGTADLGPDPSHACDYCGQRWGLTEALALSANCEHGQAEPPREFAERIQVVTLQDGSALVTLEPLEGPHKAIRITARDAEKIRVVIGRPGRAALAERWRP